MATHRISGSSPTRRTRAQMDDLKEIQEGNLKARRIGRLVRILDTDLASWMRGDRS
jgi:hypothetical protein